MKQSHNPNAETRIRKLGAIGIDGGAVNTPPAAASAPTEVFSVSVVDAGAAPGVRLVGENEAVQARGSPVHRKDAEESNEPYSGVTWTRQVAD
jgi:hypothetical protein